MTYYPVILVLLCAVIDWYAVERKVKLLEYVFKPVTMLALLGWVWLSVGLGGALLWFSIGALFCLAGDVFLMAKRDLFIFGLLAFLLGHIGYIIGLNNMAPYINLWGIVIIVLLVIYIAWLYPKLAASLKANGKNSLKIPVLVYSVVISLMVYSALMTWKRPGWLTPAALAASLGAIFFYASDSILAWDRFVKPLSHGRLIVMVTYHLGQIGIILGAMLHSTLK